jgi:hypothetical protein
VTPEERARETDEAFQIVALKLLPLILSGCFTLAVPKPIPVDLHITVGYGCPVCDAVDEYSRSVQAGLSYYAFKLDAGVLK